jgi:hypothetical protein
MLTITLAQLKSDITPMLKGTSLREVTDFYGIAAKAANRMLSRINPEETRRTVTMTTPFYDNVNDYPLASDYKRMIDIKPQANRQSQPGLSNYNQTTPRQFDEELGPNTFSIQWNNMVRTIRAQRLPSGNVALLDPFDSSTSNGSWAASVDASGFYTETLNYVEGNASLGMDLSGSTGSGVITNSTASAVDLSAYRYQDASMLWVFIPTGYSSRFTSFKLLRGESASAYKEVTVTTKADGTAFNDGWNYLMFNWNTASTTGSPTNLLNTYRKFTITYSAGTAISGFLIDGWSNSFGQLYEIEYYSEYLFRSSSGTWKSVPDSDTDLVNVSPSSYEILKTEMMVDITQIIRIGSQRASELADWRMMLNGQPPNRYIKDPQYRGLYADYQANFPSSAIITRTTTYRFDL